MSLVAVYGVPGLSFAELTFMLTDLGVGFVAAQSGKPTKVGESEGSRIVPIVFGSAKSFMDNYEKVRFRSVAFVCDTYSKLAHELNWPLLGVEVVGKGKHEYKQFDTEALVSLLNESDTLTEPCEINLDIKIYNPTASLIAKFSESALTKSHTLMYKIKDVEIRARTVLLVKAWFTGQVKNSDVLYTKLRDLHTNDKYVDDLLLVLTGKDGMLLRTVVIKSKAEPDKLDNLARKAHISPFDVRYLLSAGKKK